MSCTFGAAPSACFDGVCLATECGNNRLEPGEVCDDGNAVTGDGTCSSDCLSDETCGNGEIDPLALVQGERVPNEQCDDGDLVSGDGCSSRCRIEAGTWSRFPGAPGPMTGARMAYDSARQRLVMFGGAYLSGSDVLYSDVVYEWDGTSWQAIPTLISPPGRVNQGMAYDAARGVVVIFGGNAGDDDTSTADMWSWDGRRWQRLVPPTVPSARTNAGMVYDSARKRIVLFGGYGPGGYKSDTWTWDGTTWTQLVTTGSAPAQRAGHVMAYDPVRDVIVMAGGVDDTLAAPDERLDDTWELRGSMWTRTTTTVPEQLDRSSSLVYDRIGARMIAYGGLAKYSATSATAETLAYSNGTWTVLSDSTPGPLMEIAMAADPRDGSLLLFGGTDANSVGPSSIFGATYRWGTTGWLLTSPGEPPPRRVDPGHGVDLQARRTWVFGGTDDTGTPTNTLYSFDGSSWRTHTWSGAGPTARTFVATTFDRARRELVVFGGVTDDNSPFVLADTSTWTWNGSAWTEHAVSGPTARLGASMAYDSRRKVVVLFGGITTNNVALADTWEWNGTTWQPITPAAQPPPRGLGNAVYDEESGRVLLLGGITFSSQLEFRNDLWSYDGTVWTKLSEPTPLADRFFGALGYDLSAGTTTSFGGSTGGGGFLSDTWTWADEQWRETLVGTRPPQRSSHVVISNPTGAGLFVVGGRTDDSISAVATDMWRFEYENGDDREICDAVFDNDHDGASGCEDSDCWSRCTPSCPPSAACDASEPRCGDGTCNPFTENCRICAADCMCTAACGDTFCDSPETVTSCPGDCTP